MKSAFFYVQNIENERYKIIIYPTMILALH
jgi:hypothetical protein